MPKMFSFEPVINPLKGFRDFLIRRFTIKDSIFTLFNLDEEKHNQADMGLLSQLIKQQNLLCAGKPYKILTQDEPAHSIIYPHLNEMEAVPTHTHFEGCVLITPDELSHFLNKLWLIQKDKGLRKRYEIDVKDLADSNFTQLERMFGKCFVREQLAQHYPEVNTEFDYLPREEMIRLASEYREFYNAHKEELEKQYQQNQNDLTWFDELDELAQNSFKSAAFAALFSGMKETLRTCGVSESGASWLCTSIRMVIFFYTSSSYYPLLFTGLLNAALHYKEADGKENHLINAVLSAMLSLASYNALTTWGIVNYSLSSISAYIGSYVSSKCTQTFFGFFTKSNASPTSKDVANPSYSNSF